jgi:hypothetical protein
MTRDRARSTVLGLETSPDGAGSYRLCRRELRLPIRVLALCRAVVFPPPIIVYDERQRRH